MRKRRRAAARLRANDRARTHSRPNSGRGDPSPIVLPERFQASPTPTSRRRIRNSTDGVVGAAERARDQEERDVAARAAPIESQIGTLAVGDAGLALVV